MREETCHTAPAEAVSLCEVCQDSAMFVGDSDGLDILLCVRTRTPVTADRISRRDGMVKRRIGQPMTRRRARQPDKGALEIIEEAVHLLRLSPASLLLSYYLGSLPFILGLLYFWADMSRSAFASRHCVEAAFGLTLLFLWMKCWHAVFARQLKAQIFGDPRPRWTPRRIGRLVAAQTIIQPSGLFVLPIAMLAALPFAWTYAFYQNVSAMPDGKGDDVKTVFSQSMQQAILWPGQNHILIAVLSIFGVFVFMNLTVGILLVPQLIRILLGVETIFTLSGSHILNTTFLATVCGMSYLCVDPLVKAVYVLRCFYGESLYTGADLKAEHRNLLSKGTAVAALLILLLCFPEATFLTGATAAEDFYPSLVNHPPLRSSVSPPELNRSISKVLQQREYAWRMPREDKEPEKGLLASFVYGVMSWSRASLRAIRRWVKKILDWLGKLLPERLKTGRAGEGPSSGWKTSAQSLIFVLLCLVACTLVILFWRIWHRRRTPHVEVHSEAIAPTPDLADENVGANDLPSDGWVVMAQNLMERGELRMALRALYLASLAYLSEREMLLIAKFKSDRDYERDLRRWSHAKPDVLAAFAQNVTIFESVWYGMHEVTQATMSQFTANIERIKACG